MRFISLFAASAAAATIVTRQASVFADALNSVDQATLELQQGVNDFTGADGQVDSLTATSQSVVDAITQATSDIEGADPIASLEDALPLADPLQTLTADVQSTVQALIGKEQVFLDAGAGQTVYQQVQAIQQATDTLSSTALGKIEDQTAVGIAQELINQINTALQNAADTFQDAPGGGDGGDGDNTTTTGPSEPTTTGEPTEPTTTGEPTEPTDEPTITAPVYPTGTGAPTGAPTDSLPPYTGNAAVPTAAAGFGVAALAGLAAIAVL